MPNCAVASCKNYNQKTKGSIKYHKFPVDNCVSKRWIHACKRENKINIKYARVCSAHFCEEDYKRDLKAELMCLPPKKVLKPTAVPSQNLHPVTLVPNNRGSVVNYPKPSSSQRDSLVGCADKIGRDVRYKRREIRKHSLNRLKAILPKEREMDAGAVTASNVPLLENRNYSLQKSNTCLHNEISSNSPSSTQMEFHDHSSPLLLKVEPDLIKNEPQDEESIENTWQLASSSIIKSEPREEEIKVEEPGDDRGNFFHVYMHSGAGVGVFLQEDSEYLDRSDDIAQCKGNKINSAKVEPEDLESSELAIEDEGSAAEADRLSLEYTLITSDSQQEYMDGDMHSYLRGTYSVSNRSFRSKSLPMGSLSCNSTLSTSFCSATKNSGTNLESTKEKEYINSSKNDSSNLFDPKCELVVRVCSMCNKSFKQMQNATEHTSGHSSEKPFVCSICIKSLKQNLRKLWKIHSVEKPFVCSTCNKSYEKKESLTKHTRIHTGEKPYVCATCNKSFAHRELIKRHTRIHTGEKPFVCPTCNKAFTQKDNLRTHLLIHSGEKPHVCSTCNKSFAHKEELRKHLRIHTGDRPYACSTCNKSFTRKAVLTRHSRIHSEKKSFLCPTCNRSFGALEYLKKHSKTHSVEKPFVCSTCNKSFARKEVLRVHSRIHTGEKPYVCSACNKAFAQMHALRRHSRTHSGEKPFLCSTCGKSFTELAYLKEHSRIHSVKKPFLCSTCNKSYSWKSDLRKHLKIHTGDKPYVCSTCNKSFSKKGELRRHSGIHTR